MITDNTPDEATNTCDLSHLNGELTHDKPWMKGTMMRCGGCQHVFPIVRHPEGHYDSPQWEAHARHEQHKNCDHSA